MRYVICPQCGDPVAGELKDELTCVHCKQKFPLAEHRVLAGIVLFNPSRDRWHAGGAV